MTRFRTDRGLDRLVNFSDAAVAIAITLLILPLVDLASDIGADETFADFFVEHLGSFIGFIVTFFVIGRFWMVHHRVFELVAGYSSGLIWMNLLWLASIVFLPFAANAISELPTQSGSFYALYIGTMFVLSLSMIGIELVLVHDPSLLRDEARGAVDLGRGVAMAFTLLVAGVLAFLVPQVGLFWLFLLFLGGPVYAVLVRLFPALRAQGG
ncbi:TMEM175 family protein [Agromyces sp. MMS24-K17]|uniref:TMEM175 family protein n=1 Tax=Agromyces sp. MMS24-K17 TaxID=3372850 RepID=UPI0037546AB4